MLESIPSEWIAAITSSTSVAILSFLFGTYYKSKIEKTIQHNFDVKIESIKTHLRREEEKFRSEVKARDEQISAIRNGALSNLASRNSIIDKRRLEALDKIWSHAVSMSSLKVVANFFQYINLDSTLEAATESSSEGTKVRQFADTLWNTFNLDAHKVNVFPNTERPYVSPMVWALFTAYSTAIRMPLVYIMAMRSAISASSMKDQKEVLETIKIALPQHGELIEKFGINCLPFLIEELEKSLLYEIQKSLIDTEIDQSNLKQAADIINAANKIMNTQSQPNIKLPDI